MKTFFFYDLETSGFSPQKDRIMQFAGQRTDLELNKIGDPINILVKLNNDALPSVNALLTTKISPQKTVEEGYTEAEFAKMCAEDFFTPDTIIVGYNNIRFDDRHMQHLFWRNFFDPYEWQWKDGRSRWDLLDVVRMVRALRQDGINWPFVEDENGNQIAANKLELLTKENGIIHENAHDALSDVDGLIDVARLIREKQPKMFDFMLKIRDKKEVQNIVNLENPQPFVYTSGRLSAEFEKTTVAFPIAPAQNRNVIIWDLRFDPTPFLDWTEDQFLNALTADFETRQKEDFIKIPAKVLKYNTCPAVAPIQVLRPEDTNRLNINLSTAKEYIEILSKNPHLAENLRSAFEKSNLQNSIVEENEYEKYFRENFNNPEAKLYDGFVGEADKTKIEAVRNATSKQLADFHPDFNDDRLSDLLIHYKARSFPKSLSLDEKTAWENWRVAKIKSELPKFVRDFDEASKRNDLSKDQEFVLEELRLWCENILPDDF